MFADRDLVIVVEAIWEAREKWFSIGLCFSIPISKLNVIEKDSKDIDEKFTKMIKEWLMQGDNCNWDAVVDVLKNKIVSCESLADKLPEWVKNQGI